MPDAKQLQPGNKLKDMANLLKIATSVIETKVIEKEISFPYYFKDEFRNTCKVVSEKHILCARCDKDYWGTHTLPLDGFESRIAKGTQCTAEEFDAIYSQATMCVDLIYRNESPSKDVDENVQVDEILERRAS